MTPLVRPPGIEKPVLTEAEAAAFEKQFSERQTATTNNGYDWWDGGAAHLDHRRTSLIIDPADGHVPPLTADAQRKAAARPRATGTTDGPEDFGLNTRCIQFQNGATPLLPSPYNNNLQFIQTRDFVVLSTENIHDARIVPMDGRPHGVVRRWAGDSRGRWEQDTLVIDTINFSTRPTCVDPTRTCTSSNASGSLMPTRSNINSRPKIQRSGFGRGRRCWRSDAEQPDVRVRMSRGNCLSIENMLGSPVTRNNRKRDAAARSPHTKVS